MIRFLAEISKRFSSTINATPYNNISRQYNIYYLDIRRYPKSSYWTEWGGFYDNFTGTQLELYFTQFLYKVDSIEDVFNTSFSLYITNDYLVLFNIPKHPWLYASNETEISFVIPFLSTALDPKNPSNIILRDVLAEVFLINPNFLVRISDNISDIVLNQGFSISFANNNGYFDDCDTWNLFNTPIHLKKSIAKKPNYNDFKTIKYGLVENTITDLNLFKLEIADRLRSMDNPVCDLILKDNFPINFILDNDAINKNIPIVYGTKKIRLQKLNNLTYLAAEYVSSVTAVYNVDGLPMPYSFNQTTGLITVHDEDTKAEYALITGYTDNQLGIIIIDLICRKGNMVFSNANFNLEEVERYINISPRVNISIDQGNVKSVIQNILKNDMAFLIQQNDGRFTIRRYAETYTIHNIESWTITKVPEKSWGRAQENYHSSCIINYNFIDTETYSSLLYNERERASEEKYRRLVTKTFDTDLVLENEARELAKLLSSRYTTLRHTLKLPVGVDTSGYELMDTVTTNVKVNKRQFIKKQKYMIKEVNPAQDILILEELPD